MERKLIYLFCFDYEHCYGKSREQRKKLKRSRINERTERERTKKMLLIIRESFFHWSMLSND